MSHFGFVRVAAAAPVLRVADPEFNVTQIRHLLSQLEADAVSIAAFPELSLTAYTCGDLFHQLTLLRATTEALANLAEFTRSEFSGLVVVGLPLLVDDQVFNCAAVLHRGQVLGLVPKSHLPNYKEFYEDRWFAPAAMAISREVTLPGQRGSVPFGTDLLFEVTDVEGLVVGVEICEDLWMPVPPSSLQALHGATVLINPSASNEVIRKAAYRRELVANQSARCIAVYVYATCGVHESTTDVVFGGHCMIAEDGTLLGEATRFHRDNRVLIRDLDLERLLADRIRMGSFADGRSLVGLPRPFRRVPVRLARADRLADAPLLRTVDAHPFVPKEAEELRERCDEIFHIQIAGLAKRLEHIGKHSVAIGVSGGLDSTLALLVACKTMDAIGVGRDRVKAFTLPGFGTTARTRGNAHSLMRLLGVTFAEVDIRSLSLEIMRALDHQPFGISLAGLSVEELARQLQLVPEDRRSDLVFENVQARIRTCLLMNAGFVVGTGDVSELALGWCTFNADHMSMYNPNTSIPKSLVKFLVDWAARNEFDGEVRQVLLDIVATEISPELLPTTSEGKPTQSTESVIGPYELHDFFLYHLVRYGATPARVLFLARHARFDRDYTPGEIKLWLRVFVTRFFQNQFKRSCLPDGPKVGSVSLSPRGDWRMPSDAHAAAWLRDLDATDSVEGRL